MKTTIKHPAYIVGIHRYCFKAGEPAIVLGMKTHNNRVCYEVEYEDGEKDLIPHIDLSNYQFITHEDFSSNKIPKIIK